MNTNRILIPKVENLYVLVFQIASCVSLWFSKNLFDEKSQLFSHKKHSFSFVIDRIPFSVLLTFRLADRELFRIPLVYLSEIVSANSLSKRKDNSKTDGWVEPQINKFTFVLNKNFTKMFARRLFSVGRQLISSQLFQSK